MESLQGVPYIPLANGRMPQLGTGTRRSEPGVVRRALGLAIKAGVRHIDCAWVYGTEPEVGEAVKEAIVAGLVTRSELFITSKLWNHFHKPSRVRMAFDKSLKSLQLDYLDLYLMHWPVAYQYQGYWVRTPLNPDGTVAIDHAVPKDNSGTWAEMEKLVDAGLVRDIGVSNFCEARMAKLLRTTRIKPAVNQVELHPYYPQNDLLKYHQEKGIHLTAFSPLGSWVGDLTRDPVVVDMAKEYGVDTGRVLIAWGLSRGTSLIPKSADPVRVVNNFMAKDLVLRQDSIEKLSALDRNKTFGDPSEAWGLDIYCREVETRRALED